MTGENDRTSGEEGRRGYSPRISLSSIVMILVLGVWFICLLSLSVSRIPLIDKLIGSFTDIFFFLAFIVCSFFLGSFLTAVPLRHGAGSSLPRELYPVTVGIGLWIISLIVLILSISHLLKKEIAVSIILVALVLCFLSQRLFRGRMKPNGDLPPRSDPDENATRLLAQGSVIFERTLAALLLTLMILAFLFFLRPPVHYDSLEYHLAVPAVMIAGNSLPYFPFDVHTNFPLYVEMLYGLGLLVSGWKLANLINFLFFPLLVMVIYFFVLRLSGRTAALISSVIFASTYTVMGLTTHPLVDLEFAFFTLASFILLILWKERKEEGKAKENAKEKGGYLYLSALLTGIAAGIKYMALILTIPLNVLFLIAFLFMEKKQPIKAVLRVILYLIIVSATASPWLIRNTVNTGDPVFPAAAQQLASEKWSSGQEELLRKAANESLRTLGEAVKMPYRMSFSTSEFGSFSWVGPIYLMFLPLLFLYKKQSIDYILIIYSILAFLLWTFSFNMMRFAVPLMGVLSILMGRAVQNYALTGRSKLFRRTMLVFIVLAIVFNIAFFISRETSFSDSMSAVFGTMSEKDFLSGQLQHYNAVDFYNGIARKDSKILFIGETRTFYCKGMAVWSSAYNENPIVPIIKMGSSPPEIAAKLRSQGFTHILYSPYEMIRLNKNYKAYDFTKQELGQLADFLENQTTALFAGNNVYLLQIRGPGDQK